MKKYLYNIAIVALVATFASCQEPDEHQYTMSEIGLNSISAQFATGDYKNDASATFTTVVTADNIENIVIDIPCFYPETSDNISDMTAMRVTASLDNNYTLSPMLSTLDLTQENYLTLTDPEGATRSVMITGNHKEPSGCQILSFVVGESVGIIDQTNNKISLIAEDEIVDALATVSLSPHASFKEGADPRVDKQSYTETPIEFTVIAYDGTEATYQVLTEIPDKVAYGYREGSEREVWNNNITTTYGVTCTTSSNYTLGLIGSSLIFSTGAAQYEVDIVTGDLIGDGPVSWSMDLGAYGAVSSDGYGNLLLLEGGAADAPYTIYMTSSVDSAPVAIYTTTNPYGATIGNKISITGDLTTDAVITVPLWYGANTSGFMFIRWIVSGGVIGEAEKITVSGVQPDAWNGNMDVCYASTDLNNSLYYTVAYSANNITAINSADDTVAGVLVATLNDTNYNLNCVDVATLNGATYVASYLGGHFSYSAGVSAYMYDVTTPTYPSAGAAWSVVATRHMTTNTKASSDVLLLTSSDGYTLRLFYVDSATESMAHFDFSCLSESESEGDGGDGGDDQGEPEPQEETDMDAVVQGDPII